MTIKPIRPIAAAAAALAAGFVLAACSSNNAPGPSKAQVKDAVSVDAAAKLGQVTSTTTTTPATTTTTAPATTTTTTPTTTETTTTTASADGKEIFTTNCGACHTLAAAGTAGQVGPNLDQAKPTKALAIDRVTNGKGGMPPFKGQLSPAEITAVATYVADNAGK